MALIKSLQDILKSLSAISMDGSGSLLATDSSGNMKKIDAAYIPIARDYTDRISDLNITLDNRRFRIDVVDNKAANLPVATGGSLGFVLTFRLTATQCTQLFFTNDTSNMLVFKRNYNSGTWYAWKSVTVEQASAASLTIDDLKGVLTSEQIAKLESNLSVRREAEAARLAEEAAQMEQLNQSNMQTNENQLDNLGGG